MLLNDSEQRQLLAIAKQSIQHGLATGRPLAVNLADFSDVLKTQRASFVTLEIDAQLRGCIGMLEAIRPLVLDVAENAFAAAFQDTRFAPLSAQELPLLVLHISILSPAEPIAFSSEVDLIAQLRPHIDGLILKEGGRRGTFLPSVWESLPEPEEFFAQLKRKAGLPRHYWSETLQVFRYRTDVIH